MGNTTACCAQRDRGSDAGAAEADTGAICTYNVNGPAHSIVYTEWEEIIALSRAITPGGKLLGLSSTKKLIATLHYVPLNIRAAVAGGVAGDVEQGDAVPVLEQLTFANPDARRVAIEALIPEELSRTELTNVEHWISHNQKRIRMIKNALLEQRRARLAPDLSSSPRAMTPGQHRRRPRTRAFTKVWDDREKEKRPKTATEKRLSKIQVQSTRQRVERQRKPLSARDIFEWLENKDTHQPQNYMNHDKQRTNSWHIPGKETALYISEKERLQTTNKTGTSLSMRPVYKYIHPQELGHTNNFTRLRNYRKFSNGLHETMRRKQNEYHKPKHPQPKFKRMQAGATYRQGQTRNLTGHFIRETGSERYKNMPSDNIVYKR